MPKVGPYDLFAVNWGYREFPKGADEKAELEKLVKVQVDQPIYRFGDPNARVDSTQQTEDLGSNAVVATKLGLQNLERVAGYLVKATSKPGKDYELLQEEYSALLAQWSREMGHVANVVGGVQEINLYYGDANRRFFPNPADYQQEAVSFLLENALQTPTKFIGEDVVARLTRRWDCPDRAARAEPGARQPDFQAADRPHGRVGAIRRPNPATRRRSSSWICGMGCSVS